MAKKISLLEFNQQVVSVKISPDQLQKISEKIEFIDASVSEALDPIARQKTSQRACLKWLSDWLVENGDLQKQGDMLAQPYQLVQKFKYNSPHWSRETKGRLSIQTASNPYGSGLTATFHIRTGDRWELMQWLKGVAVLELKSLCPAEKPSDNPTPAKQTPVPVPKQEPEEPTAPTEIIELLFRQDHENGTTTFKSFRRTWEEWTRERTLVEQVHETVSSEFNIAKGDFKLTAGKLLDLTTTRDLVTAGRNSTLMRVEPKLPGGGGRGRGRGRGGSSSTSTTSSDRSKPIARQQQQATQATSSLIGMMIYANCTTTIEAMHNALQTWRQQDKTEAAMRMDHGAVQMRVFVQQVLNEAELAGANLQESTTHASRSQLQALDDISEAMRFILEDDGKNAVQVTTHNDKGNVTNIKIPFSLRSAVRTVFPQGKPPNAEYFPTSRAYKLIVRPGMTGQLLADLLTGREWSTAFPGGQHPLFQVRHMA